MNPNDPSFREAYRVEKPGIVGAKWWQEGLVEQAAVAIPRRSALAGMVGVVTITGAIAVIGGALAICGAAVSNDEVEFKTIDQASLNAQRDYGWNFGAVTEKLVFDGEQKTPFDRTALGRLRNELLPVKGDLRPFYWPTLFEAPTAMPKIPIEGESPTAPLSTVLSPIFTSAMDVAFKRGRALAALFEKATPGTAVLVDLPGPEAVAMAAGMAERFEPVATFDNWPHPRGVVPAHLTPGGGGVLPAALRQGAAAAYAERAAAPGARSQPAVAVHGRDAAVRQPLRREAAPAGWFSEARGQAPALRRSGRR